MGDLRLGVGIIGRGDFKGDDGYFGCGFFVVLKERNIKYLFYSKLNL